MMPERTSARSMSGHVRRKSACSSSVQKAHDALDAGAVVPTAVEQHDLARGRQVRDVALEVPLRSLALGRRAQRDDAAVMARVEPLHDALDRAALPGGVAALEDHDEPQAFVHDPFLHPHQLDLQARELLLVAGLGHDVSARSRPESASSWMELYAAAVQPVLNA